MAVQFNEGERVWLLPDFDKREVKIKTPAIVIKTVTSSGRVKVRYREMGCNLSKTVDAKRIEPRSEPCHDLNERLDNTSVRV